jgi:DNA-directed RNA polymerase specialized sigma54-like protein
MELVYIRISKKRTSSTAPMALTQRLQIRQSQALVMTPQLMQAIKLLQLSNLDLLAYVEGELERNPLLDRANEDETPGEPQLEREIAVNGDAHQSEDWMGQDMETSRGAMEAQLGTGLDDDGTGGRRHTTARPFRMDQQRRRRRRARRLQSRSLRLRRKNARRPSRRTAHDGHHRSGAAHDRAIPHRSRR